MDWNWFFSSLAQSTAAIVGIFGAFIITKTLSNQTSFDSKRKLIRELTSKSHALRDEANDLSIDWYNFAIAEWRLEHVSKKLDENEHATAEEIYGALNFSPYQSKDESCQLILSEIEKYKNKKQAEREAAQERMRKSGSWIDVRHAEFNIPNFRAHSDIAPVKAERAKIDAVVRSCRHHVREVKDALSSVYNNPEYSPQITYTLLLVLILFYLGVIYPLSFTPTAINKLPTVSLGAFLDIALSLKGLLLGLVSLVFSVVIIMFFVMNLRMKYAAEELEQLDQFAKLGFYSDAFEIAENHKNATISQDDEAEGTSA